MLKIALLIAATALALPAADAGSAPAGEHRGELREKALAKFDADHDGKLSESERAAARAELENHLREAKEKFDTDHDGKLSESERAAALAALSARLKQNHPELFARIDSDHDGQISPAEFRAAREKLRALRERHQAGGGNAGGHAEAARK